VFGEQVDGVLDLVGRRGIGLGQRQQPVFDGSSRITSHATWRI
jgi:hypothetical protein